MRLLFFCADAALFSGTRMVRYALELPRFGAPSFVAFLVQSLWHNHGPFELDWHKSWIKSASPEPNHILNFSYIPQEQA